MEQLKGMGRDNRNLWIILGAVLGTLVLAATVGIVWGCRRRLQRIKLLPTRTATPLDDAEFESWRRPSTYTQRPGRYTVLHKPMSTYGPMEGVEQNDDSFVKHMFLSHRTKTPPPPRPATPPRSRRATYERRRSRTSSLQDRPPTPYSPQRSETREPSSPSSVTKPERAHRYYPSVSEASDFDFDFEKYRLNLHDPISNGRHGYEAGGV